MLDETENWSILEKFLGIHLYQWLTWVCHVDNVCSKFAWGIYFEATFHHILPYSGLFDLSSILSWRTGVVGRSHKQTVHSAKLRGSNNIAKLQWRESWRPAAFKSLKQLTLPCLVYNYPKKGQLPTLERCYCITNTPERYKGMQCFNLGFTQPINLHAINRAEWFTESIFKLFSLVC